MAEEDNWLSFSLSSMEMLTSYGSRSQLIQSPIKLAPLDDSQQYCFDNSYTNGWPPKIQNMYTEDNQLKQVVGHSFHDSAPKLEDFFRGDSTALVQYSDSQTDTQDSSLTHMYDQNSGAYFTDQQDLNKIARTAPFQAFSNNSGSDVDDTISASRTQLASGEFAIQSNESKNELVYSQPPGSLPIGVNKNTQKSKNELVYSHCPSGSVSEICEKAIVSVDSQNCKKISDTFGQRTSIYRGVTRHRWTGRYEAHLWDNSCRREGQARKGRQVYLGGYDKEEKAARAYDLAALKYWGHNATTNFPVSNYTKEVEEMNNVTKQEFIASLRRKSSGFSRGASIYRGVTRHHQQGRWQARIGRVAGNKDLYLGTFATEEEAAEAYDIAAIKFRGANAVTNFEMNRYDVEAIASTSLPVGGAAKRLKISHEADQKLTYNQQLPCNSENSINFATIPYGVPFDSTTTTPLYQHHLFNHSNMGPTSTSGSASSVVSSVPLLPPPQPEFFMWPHQSY